MTNNRTVWVDHMRSFITVLVVAHHAALSYTTFAFFDASRYINSTHPVVDHERWKGLDVFVAFNDTFFMPLMFLISGLFVFKSMEKKGRGRFVADRLVRLGIPFVIAELFLIPLAYLPSYYMVHGHLNGFIHDYIVNQFWPVGPPWFIWLLLLFNMIAVVVPVKRINLWLFAVIALIAYVPLTLWVGAYTWTGWMPFDFQLNRVLFYFVFFLMGVSLGRDERWEKRLFIDRYWGLWIAGSVVVFMVYRSTEDPFLFVLCCLVSCLACMAVFRSTIKSSGNLWNNLSANAYGIYLVHYLFITWLQFAFLNQPIPVILKFFVVFAGSLTASWLIINWIRKITVFKKLL